MSDLRAPYELGEVLHRALALHLIANLDPTKNPSAEMLACARSFLRDQGIAGQAQNDKDRKALRRILRYYVGALETALTADRPSAATLAEVGKFLDRTGIFTDLGGHVEAVKAAQQITAGSLPFPY